jgi:hypothetical protein
MRKYWFFFLMASTCLEGLGRKYLPSVPSIVFYFLKDIVLLWGWFTFRPPAYVPKIVKFLYRGFIPIWGMAVLWTFLEVFNPEHMSLPLAAIGLRAYWFWWIAPFVVAAALQNPAEKRRAIMTMSVMAAGIAVFAAIQFASPADATVNLYSVVDGEAQYAANTGVVYETGRARVSSTFAFISGFADFTILIPTLLLSLGLETSDRRVRMFALVATLLSGAVLPMSGSRASVILGLGVLVLTCYSAGLFFTAIGRRIMIGAVAGAVLATVAFPDALLGVQSRFDPTETQERIIQNAMVIPPVALLASEYPMMGIGTGMQQNARASLKVYPTWQVEIEMQRYLVELGPVGFLLVWGAKFGLMVALLRAYRILQRAKRRAAASAALSYAAVTFFGNITFDHIWQALYFIGSGFILAETISALQSMAKPATTEGQDAPARGAVTVAAAGR